MPLKTGARLGPYQIDAPIGAGGMGEVYRARDTRLDRVVAIKLILGKIATDPQFKERFTREAKAISALDHPHICTLYDVGQEGDLSYLVMQYLEGETLADRIARAARTRSDATPAPASGGGATGAADEPALASLSRGPMPIETVLRYAAEIASALDAAHRHGIVHRDLKPGNVMITKSGTKLLDFGLAKLAEHGGTSIGDIVTRTSPLTGQGSFIGTLHYMSPEQLEGREVDARSDMFSFGVLLFEMLTGRRAFDGSSQAGVIAAIISGDAPSLGDLADARARLPPTARRALERLLGRCLSKDPDERWHSAADLAAELQWINDERLRGPGQDAAPVSATAPPSRGRERAWMAATAAALIALAGVAFWLWPRPAAPAAPVRFTIPEPDKTPYAAGAGLMALSPDGRTLAFVTGNVGDEHLWIRPLGSLAARMIPGTEGAWQPAWSPDSQSVIFAVRNPGGGPLKRVDVAGGPVSTIVTHAAGRAAWGAGGVILFELTGDGRLYQVSANGGQTKPVTELDQGRQEVAHSWPVFLPDGRRFIYCARGHDPSKDALFLASLDAPGRSHLVDVRSSVEYADGHLFYQRDGTLVAQPFDEQSSRLTGDAVPVAEGVQANAVNGRAAFSVSANGTLVYRTGGTLGNGTTLAWFDEAGKVVARVGGTALNGPAARLSPDRTRVVVPRRDSDSGQVDLWMIDADRGIPTRFTFGPGDSTAPVWLDGTRVIFRSNRNNTVGIYQRATSGVGSDELLFDSADNKTPTGVSADGKTLLFDRNMGDGKGWDIWALPLTGDRKPVEVVATAFDELGGVLSPDDRWLAYFSTKSGSPQVYVRSYPTPGEELQISTTTGLWPSWNADGTRLFYMTSDYHVMAAALTVSGGRLHARVPEDLFVQQPIPPAPFFALDLKGPRFLIPIQSDATSQTSGAPLTVVLNAISALKK